MKKDSNGILRFSALVLSALTLAAAGGLRAAPPSDASGTTGAQQCGSQRTSSI